eukprot:scaffold29029_cov54-Phaeocystis_antarctica.AAC.4
MVSVVSAVGLIRRRFKNSPTPKDSRGARSRGKSKTNAAGRSADSNTPTVATSSVSESVVRPGGMYISRVPASVRVMRAQLAVGITVLVASDSGGGGTSVLAIGGGGGGEALWTRSCRCCFQRTFASVLAEIALPGLQRVQLPQERVVSTHVVQVLLPADLSELTFDLGHVPLPVLVGERRLQHVQLPQQRVAPITVVQLLLPADLSERASWDTAAV